MSQDQKDLHHKFQSINPQKQQHPKPNNTEGLDSGGSSNIVSKITFQTRRTAGTYQIIRDIQDQEEPPASETEQAKKRVTKLHGINFGRSLTLQDSSYIFMSNKSNIIKILLLLGLIFVFSFSWFTSASKPTKKVKAKNKTTGNKKNRRA